MQWETLFKKLVYLIKKNLKGCGGPLCYEYDHIVPHSKGGNKIYFTILQMRNNFYQIFKITNSLNRI